MITSPDMSRFTSQVRYRGTLRFDSAHRIGRSQSLAADTTKLPILRTVDNRPYIPGSSLKGAWRSYTESIMRTVQAQTGMQDNLACLSVSMPDERSPAHAVDNGRCLTIREVQELKKQYSSHDPTGTQLQKLDKVLRQNTCLICRVFGSQWLASKVFIKDLYIIDETFVRTEIRDGVGIDRDAGRAADSYKYDYEIVPAGTGFKVEIVIENASEIELGLLMLGLEAFRRGDIMLGGAKSRGLGWCQLTPTWSNCHYMTSENLLDSLLGDKKPQLDEEVVKKWLATFVAGIREEAHDA